MSALYFFYNLLLCAAAIPAFLFLWCRYGGRTGSGFWERWGRWAGGISKKSPVIWFHAASVGEGRALTPLAKAVRSKHPEAGLVLTAMTSAGVALGKESGVYDWVGYAPLDFLWCVKSLVRGIRPRLFVLVESEFWPNLLREIRRSGAKIVVVNGRVSEKSFRNFRFMGPLRNLFLSHADRYSMRGPKDAEALLSLGVPQKRVSIGGNLKYDLTLDGASGGDAASRTLAACGWKSGEPVLVAGSTREGEEILVLEAYAELKKKFPAAKLVLVPRHPDRAMEVLSHARERNVSAALHSNPGPCEALVVDALGVLISFYASASAVFVGGSLVPKGGQNLLEPALLGKPLVFGPHMENFQESAERILQAGGAIRVGSSQELAQAWERLLSRPSEAADMGKKARDVAQSQRGATERNMKIIEELLLA